jgi:hypothetical protein
MNIDVVLVSMKEMNNMVDKFCSICGTKMNFKQEHHVNFKDYDPDEGIHYCPNKMCGITKRYIGVGDRITVQIDVDVEYADNDRIIFNDHEDSFTNVTPMYFIDARCNLHKICKDEKGYYFTYKGELPSL